MAAELLILRHGKSDWKTDLEDFHRPLKDRGKRGAQRIGVWLAQHELVPDYILSSPAERALVTAEKCCKAMGLGAEMIQQDSRLYSSDIKMLLAALEDCPAQAKRVMLVGHNPAITEFVNDMCKADIENIPTCGLVELRLPVQYWAEADYGNAELVDFVYPKLHREDD